MDNDLINFFFIHMEMFIKIKRGRQSPSFFKHLLSAHQRWKYNLVYNSDIEKVYIHIKITQRVG